MEFLYIILMIGGLIFFHELGHYLLAKWMGVHVVEFAIGVGPKIFVWTGKSKDPLLPPTQYTLGALPFGGFVKMLGLDPSEIVPPEVEAVSFNSRPVWRRFLVMVAGPAFNILLALMIYFMTGLFAAELPSSRVGGVDSNGAAWAAGLRAGDDIVAIDGDETAYFWQLQEKVGQKYKSLKNANTGEVELLGQPIELKWRRHGKLYEESFDTQAVAIDQVPSLPGLMVEKRGQLGVTQDHVLAIIAVDEDSLAYQAGLRSWDRIVAIEGEPVQQLSVALDRLGKHEEGSLLVSVLRYEDARAMPLEFGLARYLEVALPAGSGTRGVSSSECLVYDVLPESPAAELGLKRGDRLLSFEDTTCATWAFFDQSIKGRGEEGGRLRWLHEGQEREGTLRMAKFLWPHELKKDFTIGAHGIQVLMERAGLEMLPNEARLAYAWYQMNQGISDAMNQTVSVLGGILSGRVAIKDGLAGPVTMGQLAAKTSEFGWRYFFMLMAGFSVSLGLLNLLPIPVLDGGQILFLAIEGVRRKPVSLRVKMMATYAGLSFLVILMVIVFRYDLERCWG